MRVTGRPQRLMLLGTLLLLVGCSSFVAPRYAIAPANVAGLRAIRGNAINVGLFTAAQPGRREIACRAAGPITTPDGDTFEELIRKAFVADLTVADAYAPTAPVTVTGRVDALDASSGSYGSAAWWAFTVTLSSSNGTRLTVDTRYPFSAGYAAWEGCSQTAAALLPAVQDLIGKLIGHPDFAALVR